MLKDVVSFIEHHKLIQSGSTVVVGLSGGPDSVCLLHLLYTLRDQYNLSLIAVHIDHQWRPTSGDDALFCKQFAESLSIPFILKKASESPLTGTNGSKEDLGRRIRRSFFEEIAANFSAQCIALA
ncbi:tRNA lysidine(34) synthetase TilS, partial [Candidatus Dependentiae bacterium]|nr:tRNA lysidine(34) synthetase TilS [Candidatus Dependentiae bacterium]